MRPTLVGLVGTGVGPSLTPAMHMARGRATTASTTSTAPSTSTTSGSPRSRSASCWAGRGARVRRLNVTHPCKQLVLPHLDHLEDRAAAARSGQHRGLRRDGSTIGHNTDTTGFATALATGLPEAPTTTRWSSSAPAAPGRPSRDALLACGTERLVLVDVDPRPQRGAGPRARRRSRRAGRDAPTPTSCPC